MPPELAPEVFMVTFLTVIEAPYVLSMPCANVAVVLIAPPLIVAVVLELVAKTPFAPLPEDETVQLLVVSAPPDLARMAALRP
jgi:hypothetical protein